MLMDKPQRGYWCECWTEDLTKAEQPALLASFDAYAGFTQEPRKPNPLPDMPPELAAAVGPWAHAYTRCFRGPLMAQKQIILNAIARSGIAVATVDVRAAICH